VSGKKMAIEYQTATFGAGCFWGVESRFRDATGVVDAEVGYAGGHTDKPTYRDVCSGTTNHAEVVKVIFDPNRISYEDLIDLFWQLHDPTTLNRQGPDVGTQYRSVIFTHSDDQHRIALEKLKDINASGHFSRPVVTQIDTAPPFFRAEEYHQRYFEKTGRHGSCH
jgi:peptide-methionine (S)-S-oxide reductase